jgi:hypothetical protein
MRDALRRLLVTFVALAFLGGTLERAASLPCVLAGGMQTMGTGHETQASAKEQLPSEEQATKCFLYCTSGFSLIPDMVSDIERQISPVLFPILLKTFAGRSVVLDPGIPKRTT